jgi:hypothetical protein
MQVITFIFYFKALMYKMPPDGYHMSKVDSFIPVRYPEAREVKGNRWVTQGIISY